MRLPRGAYYRFKTYPSGRKFKVVISAEGRILEQIPMPNKVARTKTGRKLAKRKRRIGIR